MATKAEKQAHAALLRKAMSLAGVDRLAVGDEAGVNVRTVTNWTTGKTMPSERERVAIRRVVGRYDLEGDPVEVAIANSELVDWRQDAVRSVYRRNLAEQREERAG